MQIDGAKQPTQKRRRKSRALWICVLILVAILTVLRVKECRQAQDAWNSYLSEQNRIGMIDAACWQKVNSFDTAFSASQRRRPTLVDLAKQFDGGKDSTNRDQFGHIVFTDSMTGGRATVELFPDQTISLITPGDFSRPALSMPGQPDVIALVISFIAGVVFTFILIGRFIPLAVRWPEWSRQERLRSAWTLVPIALITIHLAWMGSKFFPGFQPFGDAQILGYQLVSLSPALVFLLAAYLSKPPGDGIPRCHHCEYDLTGNISGTCPECGMLVISHEAA